MRHILLTVDEEQPGCQLEAVRPRLQALQAELADEPHRFGELALRHSERPTGTGAGRIGYVVRGSSTPSWMPCCLRYRLGSAPSSRAPWGCICCSVWTFARRPHPAGGGGTADHRAAVRAGLRPGPAPLVAQPAAENSGGDATPLRAMA